MTNSALSNSIQDKNVEVHYDSKTIKSNKGYFKVLLQGKIQCKVLNCKITPLVCAMTMETKGWPRQIDGDICNKMGCFICKSIKKNMNRNPKRK